jgi:hypothetical protein
MLATEHIIYRMCVPSMGVQIPIEDRNLILRVQVPYALGSYPEALVSRKVVLGDWDTEGSETTKLGTDPSTIAQDKPSRNRI